MAAAALLSGSDAQATAEGAAGLDRTRAISDRTNTLLAMLDGDKRAKVLFTFRREPVATAAHFKGGMRGDVDMVGERYGDAVWSNFPVSDVPRPGLRIGALNGGQRRAVHDLLQALLSVNGYRKVQVIMGSDQCLVPGFGGVGSA